MLRRVNVSLLQIGETAATISPFFNYSSLKAIPQQVSLRQQVKVPSTMSKATPMMSPEANWVPQFGPVELLLCLVCPLQMAHPWTPSEKASSRLAIVGLQTPILMSCPLLMNISKQYLPPQVNISVPIVVLKPLPSVDFPWRHYASSLILLLVLATSQVKRAKIDQQLRASKPSGTFSMIYQLSYLSSVLLIY